MKKTNVTLCDQCGHETYFRSEITLKLPLWHYVGPLAMGHGEKDFCSVGCLTVWVNKLSEDEPEDDA